MNQIRPKVLITGGGRRIGAALSAHCARLGFEVWLHVHRSRSAAEALLQTLQNKSCHRIVECDLSDPAARQRFIASLPEFDLVVNNASVYRLTPPGARESAADRERYWQVNYFAPLEIIRKQFLQTSSNSGTTLAVTLLDCDVLTNDGGLKAFQMPEPGVDSYLASRIKLAHELKQSAARNAPRQRINAIAPGPVLPPVNCTTRGMTVILDKVPLKHPVGVEEIANAVEFFWKNHSLTGVILPVDGGMHLN